LIFLRVLYSKPADNLCRSDLQGQVVRCHKSSRQSNLARAMKSRKVSNCLGLLERLAGRFSCRGKYKFSPNGARLGHSHNTGCALIEPFCSQTKCHSKHFWLSSAKGLLPVDLNSPPNGRLVRIRSGSPPDPKTPQTPSLARN